MPKQRTLALPQRTVPIVAEVDVLVAGGGTAGLAAALAAARQGASTMIVDALGSLGGTLSNGLMETSLNFAVPFMRKESRSVSGLLKEMMDRVSGATREYGLADSPSSASTGPLLFDAEIMKYVALQMVEEAGIRMLYHSMVDDVLIEDGALTGVVMATKAGRQAILCRIAVDASGDADLAAMAGVPFQVGHQRDGHGQAVTLMFRTGGVDEERLPKNGDWWRETLLKAVAAGDLELPEHVIGRRFPGALASIGRASLLPGIRTVNIDILDSIDGSKPENITLAQNECRKRIMKLVRFWQKYVPGAERCFLVDTAPLIGFRESRRILGDYVYSWDDFRTGRKFTDTVWASVMPMDLHDPLLVTPQDPPPIHTWGGSIPAQTPPRGDFTQVPYKMLLAQKVENLLVAGRCVSSDYFTQGAFRMVPSCVATGQAAGTAAGLALKEGTSLRDLAVEHLQASLREQGVDLEDEVRASMPEPLPPVPG